MHKLQQVAGLALAVELAVVLGFPYLALEVS